MSNITHLLLLVSSIRDSGPTTTSESTPAVLGRELSRPTVMMIEACGSILPIGTSRSLSLEDDPAPTLIALL